MKFSTIVSGTAFVLVSVLIFTTEAGKYNNHAQQNNYAQNNGYNMNGGGGNSGYGSGSSMASYQSYPASGCRGYNCNQSNGKNSKSHKSAYGPYHSYAVRPAVYGGHGMYQYRGYSRYPPPPAAHYRPVRSYGCTGYNCGNNNQNNHYMRPVKAVAYAYGQQSNRNSYNRQQAQRKPYGGNGGHRKPSNGGGHRYRSGANQSYKRPHQSGGVYRQQNGGGRGRGYGKGKGKRAHSSGGY